MHNHILAQLPLFGKSGCIFDGGYRQIESSAADASDRHLTRTTARVWLAAGFAAMVDGGVTPTHSAYLCSAGHFEQRLQLPHAACPHEPFGSDATLTQVTSVGMQVRANDQGRASHS